MKNLHELFILFLLIYQRLSCYYYFLAPLFLINDSFIDRN